MTYNSEGDLVQATHLRDQLDWENDIGINNVVLDEDDMMTEIDDSEVDFVWQESHI